VTARRSWRAAAAAAAVAAAVAALAGAARGQTPPPIAAPPVSAPAAPGSELRVYLLTIGWGEAVWQRFGHNAIWISDPRTGMEVAYNWGMFDFDQPNFLGRFLTGETRYWMEPIDARAMVQHYARVENRSVWRQELALTPAQRVALLEFVTWNAREENRYYRYDYYLDNCSTRVRDALDRVLGGAIRRATEGAATGTSFRWHTRRLTADQTPTYAGIQLALGRPADRPISAWEEGFLPVKLMEHVRRARVAGADGGGEGPLVVREDTLHVATRGPERAAPPSTLGYAAAVGLALAAAIALLGRGAAAAARRGRRSLAGGGLATLGGVWALVSGLAGVALLLAGTATRHVFMGRNLNLAVVNPLALVVLALLLAALAARAPDSRRRWGGRAAAAAGVLAALSAVGALLMLLPATGQRSWDVYAVALPTNLALWWALGAASGRAAASDVQHEPLARRQHR
jgi:hypothetical protein